MLYLAELRFHLFSQTTDYALRATAHLALCTNGTSTITEMAKAIQVNSPYLRKVVDKLRNANIVSAQRGKGGGITLAVDPNQLTMLDVINAVDPIPRIKQCPIGRADHLKLCPLHAELDAALAHVEGVLGSRTIGDLLATRRSASRCEFPKCEEIHQLSAP